VRSGKKRKEKKTLDFAQATAPRLSFTFGETLFQANVGSTQPHKQDFDFGISENNKADIRDCRGVLIHWICSLTIIKVEKASGECSWRKSEKKKLFLLLASSNRP
jgi:hypothetical protein